MDTMAVELPDLTTHAPQPPVEETAEEKWVLPTRKQYPLKAIEFAQGSS